MKTPKPRWIVWLIAGGLSFGVWLFVRSIMAVLGFWREARIGSAGDEFKGCLAQAIHGVDLLVHNVPIAFGIFLSAGMFGYWLLQCRFPVEKSSRKITFQWVLFGLGLGLFCVSLSVLFLGLAGIGNRWVFIGFLVVIAIPHAVKWIVYLKAALPRIVTKQPPETGRWLAIVLIPLATLTLMAALAPAGILWRHDGNGFDALEYHLQLPHEYFQVGRIQRIEHNVYSHFPANTEMLYLLAMVLKNDAVEGMYLAQLLNVMLAGLLMISVYAFCGSNRRATLVVAAIAGPQLVFVAANAYVECYMLWMFFLAGAAVFYLRINTASSWKRWVLAGLFAGAACGCKYTAVVLVLPVVLWWVGWSAEYKIKAIFVTALAAVVAFSPWLIKNACYCGNPVFPQAMNVLGQSDWSEEQVLRWQQAHQPSEGLSGFSARTVELGNEVVNPFDYGGLFFLLFIVLLMAGRNGGYRPGVMYGAAIVAQVGVWFFCTHLQSRFLLPILVPAAFWMAGAWDPIQTWKKIFITVVLVLVVMVNTGVCVWAYNASTRGLGNKYGFCPVVRREDVARSFLPFSDPANPGPPGTTLWLVGESRPFYLQCDYIYNTVFDRNELIEMIQAGRSGSDIIAFLKQCGVTHIFVNWHEMARLNKSYDYARGFNRKEFLHCVGDRLVTIEDESVYPFIKDEPVVPSIGTPLFELYAVRRQ